MTFQPAPRKSAFQLLDDLAVAAHRPVEALQVAVDDEDEVVELLARRPARSRRGLSGSSVSPSPRKAQTLRSLGVGQAAGVQVLEEARLVDRHQRAEAHRDGRELPEIRHQPGMRIGGEAVAVDLLTEAEQLLLGEPAFEEGAGVDAGRGVALDVDQVAAVALGRRMPEMHEAGVVEGRRRLEAGDVAAEFGGFLVGAQHDGRGVPADGQQIPPPVAGSSCARRMLM